MAERIQLGPDDEGLDQWVVFRDPSTMTNRQRRPYMNLLFKMRRRTWRPDEDADAAWLWGLATSFMLVNAWSRPEELPTDYDLFVLACEELPVGFTDAMTLAASQSLMGEVDELPPTEPAKKPARKATARKATKKKA